MSTYVGTRCRWQEPGYGEGECKKERDERDELEKKVEYFGECHPLRGGCRDSASWIVSCNVDEAGSYKRVVEAKLAEVWVVGSVLVDDADNKRV